ncbi:hypothetical protein [Paenarthrobacter ilicis]|uniref:hypothetical protein n=1 Tax=Paenarthrobacter ilicis TaxID=43665 RepID=UPI0028D68DAC|nr:hypothetical protein [Paenarthrobacter ilicis]
MSGPHKKVIQAVEETGKAGSVTLVIKVDPDKKAPGVFRISDNVSIKVPAHDRGTRIYFKDDSGNLSRSNPNQPELEGLRDVSAPAEVRKLKEVN